MKRVLICDDEARATRSWHEQLETVPGVRDTFEVLELPVDRLPELVDALEERRELARGGGHIKLGDLEIDKVDVLIVDYDLLKVSRPGFITGENIAYLARCYSGVGLIIGLNQFYRDNSFDLTLRGHPESFADINISDKQLTNPGLWINDWPRPSFRPWHWPVIPELAERLGRRTADLLEHLDDPVSQYLAFPENVFDFLDREVIAFVAAGPDDDIRSVSFRQFVERSGHGFRGRDESGGDELCARVAAARIGKWLENAVLRNQDVLVDLPHLVERAPSIVNGATDPEAIQNSATLLRAQAPGLRLIADAAFSRMNWLSREAWWWPVIEGATRLPELQEPWKFAGLSVVFCEDTSGFVALDDAQPFVSGLSASFARRYVSVVDDIAYRPQVRFARV